MLWDNNGTIAFYVAHNIMQMYNKQYLLLVRHKHQLDPLLCLRCVEGPLPFAQREVMGDQLLARDESPLHQPQRPFPGGAPLAYSTRDL